MCIDRFIPTVQTPTTLQASRSPVSSTTESSSRRRRGRSSTILTGSGAEMQATGRKKTLLGT